MNSKDIVDELINEWEAAKMDTPHGLPAFKKAADEITRLREETQRLWDAVSIVLDNATGHPGGEAHCNHEAFTAFEKLVEEIESEVSYESNRK